MSRSILPLGLLLLAPGLCAGQEFHVTGPGLVGRATVTPTRTASSGDRPVSVLLTYRGVQANAPLQQRSGRGVLRRTGILEWSPGGAVPTNPRDAIVGGIIDHLLGGSSRSGYRGAPGGALNQNTYVLSPFNNALVGVVDGTQQTWTPAATTLAARRNATAQNLTVLVVPGWSQPARAGFAGGVPQAGYLDETLAAIQVRGFQARRATTNPLSPVLTNARQLANEIVAEARQGRRVILVAHGKGAADATAAIALAPQLERYVAGVLAIQPAYGGSPVLDWIATGQARHVRAVQLLKAQVFGAQPFAPGYGAPGYGAPGFGAPPPSAPLHLDMTTQQRAIFVAQYRYPAQRVPTVAIRTTLQRAGFGPLVRTDALIRQTFNQGSDGLVTTSGQTIPGATHIDLRDVDHFEGGARGASRTSPAALTNQGLTALINRLPASSFSGISGNVPSLTFNLGPVRVNLPLGR